MFTSEEPLRLQSQERDTLQAVIRSTRSPAGWVRRAQVLLLLAEGLSVRRVEAQTGMSLRRCEVVSAGGTGTCDITGNNPRVTEIQAGSYLFMDNFHANLVPDFSKALTVLGTVVIQHGNTIVLDSGHKSVGIDFVLPSMVDYPFY
jgi:D-serine deaminase-like pyridoxal phosphate-dependent protein